MAQTHKSYKYMPEEGSPNILQTEIQQLERDLELKKRELGQKQESGEIAEVPREKETLRQVIGEKIQQTQPSRSQSALSDDNQQQSSVSPSSTSEEFKSKIQELINIAFSKSISNAIKEARATGNAALIDSFHDTLVDELYNYLIERGKLKKL